MRYRRLLPLLCLVTSYWIAASPYSFGQSYGVDLRNTLMPASGGMAGTSVAAPQDCVSAETQSCGAATLVPAMPPDAGINVLRRSTPYDCPNEYGEAAIQYDVTRQSKGSNLR